MVTIRLRLLRAGLLLGLIVALAVGAAFDANWAIARPFTTGGPGGEPYGTGDPTGDDIPSPTPKPSARVTMSARHETAQGSGAQNLRHGGFDSSSRWRLYIRLLARLAIR